MTEAMYDLLYIIDIVVRTIMMLTIIWGIIYWLRGPRDDN